MSKSVVTSRRSFIKGAVAGAVSAGVAPVMAAPAPQNGLPAKWDGEADVVIVGFGGAVKVLAPDDVARLRTVQKSLSWKRILRIITTATPVCPAVFSTARSKTVTRKH